MLPFLKTIAQAYANRYKDLSEICFLFPNKRSGTFFLKYLKEEFGRHVVMAPEVKTITDFVGDISERVVASRIDMLFLLYECYRNYLGLSPEEDESESAVNFDSFINWGETVISDFNEVDQYLVNPEEIFKNVKDYREITSTFLTDEQKKVMEEYFGRTDKGDTGRFWKNFDGEESRMSEVKQKFLHLWRVMWPLYERFKERLEREGLSTTGGMYREAARRLTEEGRDILPYKKIVVVGFNALSTAEQSIFNTLKDFEGYPGFEEFTDFFWDATGPVLSKDINSASKFVKSNIKRYPCPEWALSALQKSDNGEMPKVMRVAASPSNSAQVKIAGKMLGDLKGRLSADMFKDARVGVVLPDENLLLPMLYSFPEGMGDVNLTMGYPFRLTSVVPFVTLLRKLYYNIRNVNGEPAWYAKDLKLLFSHPFSHALFGGEKVINVINKITVSHKLIITREEMEDFSSEDIGLLSGPDRKSTPEESLKYLDRILAVVAAKLPELKEGLVKARLEVSHIRLYRENLRRLKDILGVYGQNMRPHTVYRLADRLLGGETVRFEGEPLKGLQVMGMLETRSIDFDHVFILSANERILPRRARSRSFIPDSLRYAYGLPPSNYAEGIFAYYFYRMISRAKEVTIIYDARSGGGLRSGDVSRYILQLRHLFAKDNLIEEDWKFILSGKPEYDPTVEKTPEIMARIDEFCQKGGKYLSASALQSYRECQVKFFYKSVMGMKDDPEPTEFIDAISAGNILHRVMEHIYLPEKKRGKLLKEPALITAEKINGLLNDLQLIERLVKESVNISHYKYNGEKINTPLSGASEMVAEQIVKQVIRVLQRDRMLTPFRLYGVEIKDNFPIELPSGKKVNFKFAIDRLDEIMTEEGPRLRIVDYKTGSIKLTALTFDELFQGDYKSEQVFQLFTYAWLLEKMPSKPETENVRMEIYDVPGIAKGVINLPQIGKMDEENGKMEKPQPVKSYREYSEEFDKGMMKMLDDIFHAPFFTPCAEGECGLCRFKTLCHR